MMVLTCFAVMVVQRYIGILEAIFWDAGTGISGINISGFAASTVNWYTLENGTNITRRSRPAGTVINNYPMPTEVEGDPQGLGYDKLARRLIVVDADEYVYMLKLAEDFNSITSVVKITTSGEGSRELVGAGVNDLNRNWVLNDMGDTGQYAEGIPEPGLIIPAMGILLAGFYKRVPRTFFQQRFVTACSPTPNFLTLPKV